MDVFESFIDTKYHRSLYILDRLIFLHRSRIEIFCLLVYVATKQRCYGSEFSLKHQKIRLFQFVQGLNRKKWRRILWELVITNYSYSQEFFLDLLSLVNRKCPQRSGCWSSSLSLNKLRTISAPNQNQPSGMTKE